MNALRWSPTNGALACAGSDGRAHLLKPTGERLGKIPGDDGDPTTAPGRHPAIHALGFSKGSRYLATGGASGDVVIWDLKRKAKLKTLSGHAADVDALVYSPGDQHIASGDRAGVVVLHSPISGLAVGEMRPDVASGGVTSLQYSPHRRQMLAGATTGGAVHLWDTGVRRLGSSLHAGGEGGCTQAAFSPTTPGLIAAACGDGRVSLLDANAPASSANVGSIRLAPAGATSVTWRSDGYALAVGTGDGRVLLVDPRMLSSSIGGGGDGAVTGAFTAHAGDGAVTALRWQHAADSSAGAAAAAEAVTPTPMRPARPVAGGYDGRATGGPVAGGGGRLAFTPVADANAGRTPSTPTMGRAASRSTAAAGTAADPGPPSSSPSMDELKEDSRRRVERLISARSAGGTPPGSVRHSVDGASQGPAAGAAEEKDGWRGFAVMSADAVGSPVMGAGGGSGGKQPPPRDTLAITPLNGREEQRQRPWGHASPNGSGPRGDDGLAALFAETLMETKKMVHAEVRNVHVEVLKQFHEMREEQLAMFEEIRGAQRELAAEVAALRRAQQEYVRS